MVYTSQPSNACVLNSSNQCITDNSGPKIPVTYPNMSGAGPGAQIPLWSFDHNTVQWYQYGTGTVSADGKTIAPNAGVGLRDFSWHFPAASPDGNMYLPWSLSHPADQIPYQFTTAYLALAFIIFVLSYTRSSREAPMLAAH